MPTAFDLYGRASGAAATQERPQDRQMSITDLQPGQSMVVARLESSDRPRLYKLLALGILPGVVLTLRRRSPCYLIDVGQAQLALDASAAGTIFGQRNG